LPVCYRKTEFVVKLASIVLGNYPNGVDHTRKPEKTGEKEVYPKISANSDCQKYAQGGNENCSEYAN
jgi:hypothetical protein